MKRISFLFLLTCWCAVSQAQLEFIDNRPQFKLRGKTVVTAPEEGLWSVATGWDNDWMTGWKHTQPARLTTFGEWTLLVGELELPEGKMVFQDAYQRVAEGLYKVVRRFEWKGIDTLKQATLSVRWQMKGEKLKPFLPGILYYGNSMGAQVNPNIIPVYTGTPGEFAIFEDHRYPMPFAMLEDSDQTRAVALHTVPSSVRGALLSDQWWSLGVEAYDGYSECVLYSGPIGYNRKHSVAKALQQEPMRYTNTYLDLEPGRVIEKEFYIDLYAIDRPGNGFSRPIYTSLDLYKPYTADVFPDFQTIVEGKYRFAQSRWIEQDSVCGFGMYDLSGTKDIVMGWCGQADSPGFAWQWLEKKLNDKALRDQVQRSLDFLSTYPIDQEGAFPVGYRVDGKQFHGGDPVSCGQAMYNFAKAIETARKNKKYDTRKWAAFLQNACDGQSRRILRDDWNPLSTAEGFYIAPLAIAARLFKNDMYKKAALKAAQLYADRHMQMDGCYWGGTLDATCEDKEGAWAAFQGFLELYDRFKQPEHLTWAQHAMNVCLSYVVVWDIPLPPGRLADHHFKSTGWTVVSPQNQHIDVYGVLFAPEVYKMGIYLKDDRLKKLAAVMYRSCYQLTNPMGSQGEQLQQTNFAQHGDMSDVHKLRGGYSEGWTVFWITAHFLNAAARFQEMGVTP